MSARECALHYVRSLYQSDYVVCKLYEEHTKLFRVFEFQDIALQRELIKQLMEGDESYFLAGSTLCYKRPFVEGILLTLWIQQEHTLQACIALCEDILFELMQQPLSNALLATTVQLQSIAIDEQQKIQLFQHPHFLLLRHTEQINLFQECGALCYKLLSSSTQLQHRRYRRKKQWKLFLQHLEDKHYDDYEPLLDDLVALKKLVERKKLKFDKATAFAAYTLLILVLLAFSTLGYIKLSDYLHRTYERLPYIGTQPTRP